MVNESRDASGVTPTTVGRSSRAGMNEARVSVAHADASVKQALQFEDCDSDDQGSEEEEEEVEAGYNYVVGYGKEAEERSLHVGRVVTPQLVVKNIADAANEEDDGSLDVTLCKITLLDPRVTRNVETPLAYRALQRLGEEMKKSKWIKQFHIERSTQASWSELRIMLNMT